MFISTKHQHELAIGLPMSPPAWTFLPLPSPLHPSRLLPSPDLSCLSHTARQWQFLNNLIEIWFTYSLRFTRLNSMCNSVFSSIFIELCNHHYDLILEPDLLFKRSSWLLCGERIIEGEKDKRIVSGGYWCYPGERFSKWPKENWHFFTLSLHQLPTT